MAPDSRIYLTRHAQAEHNVDLDYSILDAPLTSLGKKQAAALAPKISGLHEKVDLIVTSALQRTLQTTLLAWGPAVQSLGIENVICLPEAQECNSFPCDKGSDRSILEKNREFAGLDFSRLTPDWTSKTGFWASDPVSLANRARFVRQFLRDRPEKDIVLVAHGDFLRQITGNERGPSEYMWKNVEVRIFNFDERTVETEECFLSFESAVEGAKGYAWRTTEGDLNGENCAIAINGRI